MVNKDKRVVNVANALSVFRMLMAPVFMFLVFYDKFAYAFMVLLIATLTDFLDGHVARIYKLQTRIGKLLDPVADKVIMFFAVIMSDENS